MHYGVEVTESRTNKQHTLSQYARMSQTNSPMVRREFVHRAYGRKGVGYVWIERQHFCDILMWLEGAGSV